MASNNEGSSVDPPQNEDSHAEKLVTTGESTALNFAANHVNTSKQQISNNEGKVSLRKININDFKEDKSTEDPTSTWRPSKHEPKVPMNDFQEKNGPQKFFQDEKTVRLHGFPHEKKSIGDTPHPTNQPCYGNMPSWYHHSGARLSSPVNGGKKYSNDEEKVQSGHQMKDEYQSDKQRPHYSNPLLSRNIPQENHQFVPQKYSNTGQNMQLEGWQPEVGSNLDPQYSVGHQPYRSAPLYHMENSGLCSQQMEGHQKNFNNKEKLEQRSRNEDSLRFPNQPSRAHMPPQTSQHLGFRKHPTKDSAPLQKYPYLDEEEKIRLQLPNMTHYEGDPSSHRQYTRQPDQNLQPGNSSSLPQRDDSARNITYNIENLTTPNFTGYVEY